MILTWFKSCYPMPGGSFYLYCLNLNVSLEELYNSLCTSIYSTSLHIGIVQNKCCLLHYAFTLVSETLVLPRASNSVMLLMLLFILLLLLLLLMECYNCCYEWTFCFTYPSDRHIYLPLNVQSYYAINTIKMTKRLELKNEIQSPD